MSGIDLTTISFGIFTLFSVAAWICFEAGLVFDLKMPFRLAWAAIKTGWAKFRGYRALCTLEEQSERLNECNSCEELTDLRQCRVCKCFVDEKTLLTSEKCPKRKWLQIRSRNNTVLLA